uniref:Uncharacterized protein n=1 Tax=Paramormyrops kingsleyae TaxID=1676925 RepID=A0A3B3QIT6_9TELE
SLMTPLNCVVQLMMVNKKRSMRRRVALLAHRHWHLVSSSVLPCDLRQGEFEVGRVRLPSNSLKGWQRAE